MASDESKAADGRTRVLITGASGLLGRAVLAEFQGHADAYDVTGTAFSRSGGGLVKVDLCDSDAVAALIRDLRPHAIVHAAAERRPDVCEGDATATTALNVSAPATIGRVAKEVGAWVLYISTDYVFDGTSPPYTPESKPNPLNSYGKSKLDGERAILAEHDACAVLRVPVLFGRTKNLSESAVTSLAIPIVEKQAKAADAWAVRRPTFCDDVAVVIRQLVSVAVDPAKPAEASAGIFHWSGNESMNKYEQSKLMASILGADDSLITPAEGPPAGAPRPRDCTMDTSRLASMGIGQHTPVASALATVLRGAGVLGAEADDTPAKPTTTGTGTAAAAGAANTSAVTAS